MSTTESIYNLVPKEYVAPPKPAMYYSKFDHKANPTGSTFGCFGANRLLGAGSITRKSCATLGPVSPSAPNPKNFLRKGEKVQRIPSRTIVAPTSKHLEQGERKPGVPSHAERPVMGLKSNKNFITANAIESILASPPVHEVNESDYLHKADYGKVPQYLGLINKEIKRENEMIDQYVKEQMGVDAPEEQFDEIGDKERQELINALKTKWDAVNAAYQKMTHMGKIHAAGTLKRKENFERELRQLESDIGLLEKQGQLLIHAG